MKRYVSIPLVCFFVLLCLFVPSFSAHSQEKVIKLRYANFFPPVHKNSIVIEEWCKEVEKRTDGRVKITLHSGGTLVPAHQAYESVVRGIADIANAPIQYAAGRFPLTEAIDLPLGIKNGRQGTKLIMEWYKKFKPKEYDDVKIIYLTSAPPGVFQTIKPLGSINDLKDLKIRAAGDTQKVVSAMGAVPIATPISDIYEGLQRGMLDGVIFPAEALKGWRFGDFIRGIQDNSGIGYGNANGVVMNKGKWNALPSDIQKIINKLDEEWVDKQGRAWDEIDQEGIQFGVSRGMRVFTISPEEVAITREKMKPLFTNFLKSMKEKGLPGEESLKFCQDWLKAHPY